MRLRPDEIERISKKLLGEWKSSHLVQFKTADEKILRKISDTFLKNLQEEVKLENEAEKMLVKLEKQALEQDIDRRKMLSMIKRQLAKEKGFVL